MRRNENTNPFSLFWAAPPSLQFPSISVPPLSEIDDVVHHHTRNARPRARPCRKDPLVPVWLRPMLVIYATVKVPAQTTSATVAALEGAEKETKPSKMQKVLIVFWLTAGANRTRLPRGSGDVFTHWYQRIRFRNIPVYACNSLI